MSSDCRHSNPISTAAGPFCLTCGSLLKGRRKARSPKTSPKTKASTTQIERNPNATLARFTANAKSPAIGNFHGASARLESKPASTAKELEAKLSSATKDPLLRHGRAPIEQASLKKK